MGIHHLLRNRLEVGYRDYGLARAEGETLGHTRRKPDTGEPSWASAECDSVEIDEPELRVCQQRIDHWQNVVGMSPFELDVRTGGFLIVE
jgi:hypothetical protein